MGTIAKMVQLLVPSFRQMPTKLTEFTQLRWWVRANYFQDRVQKNGMAELKSQAVVIAQMEMVAALTSSTIFQERMDTLDIVLRMSQMRHATSCTTTSHMSLGSRKPQ